MVLYNDGEISCRSILRQLHNLFLGRAKHHPSPEFVSLGPNGEHFFDLKTVRSSAGEWFLKLSHVSKMRRGFCEKSLSETYVSSMQVIIRVENARRRR